MGATYSDGSMAQPAVPQETIELPACKENGGSKEGQGESMKPPSYFERVRESAARRWDQLESDPELAGPWHQLFSQVQSPRHVLSELLQNADDAGATEARVSVEDRAFHFEH